MIVNNKLVSHIPFSVLLHLEKEDVLDKEETNKYILNETGNYFPKFKKKMAKYKCNNKNCNLFDEIIEEHNSWTRYINGKKVDMIALCSHCKQDREMVEDDPVNEGFCINMTGGNGNICNK